MVVVAGALDDELKAWTNSGSREGMAPSPLVGRCQAFTALLPTAVFRKTKISGLDPPLTPIWTAYPAQPLQPLFHPPVECAASGPCG